MNNSSRTGKIRPIFYIAVSVYVCLIIFNVIPATRPAPYPPMGLVYPPTMNNAIDLTEPSNFMFIELTLSANDTLAEQVPVRMNAKGSIGAGLLQQTSSIVVGVSGAYAHFGPVQLTPIGTPFVGIRLHETAAPVEELTVIVLGQLGLTGDDIVLTWPVQGDYYPIVVIQFKNFTTKVQSYQDYHVHVEPASIIQEQRFNRNTETLGIAGIAIIIFEGLIAIDKKIMRRKSSSSSGRWHDHNTHDKTDGPENVEMSRVDNRTRFQEQHAEEKREKNRKRTKIKQNSS